jgi:hypothetical protein
LVGPLTFAALLKRVDFIDRLAAILVSLLALSAAGTAWVLAARANQVNGWGQLNVGEVLLVLLVAFGSALGTFFILCMWALGHMH